MSALITGHAARIRELHAEAQALAEGAIERALEAGELLAEVKETLPHGDFGAWVEENCGFTVRTAQRYMRLHEHRGLLPDGTGVKAALAAIKSDTVSHLDAGGLERDEQRLREELLILSHALDAAKTPEACALIARRASEVQADAMGIQARAERSLGQLLNEIDALKIGAGYRYACAKVMCAAHGFIEIGEMLLRTNAPIPQATEEARIVKRLIRLARTRNGADLTLERAAKICALAAPDIFPADFAQVFT